MSPPRPSTVLLDYAQDIVALLDDEGAVTFVNAPVGRLLGWEPAELVGRNAFELIHSDDVEEAKRAFERTTGADGFAEAVVEHRFRTSDGSWVWLESRMSNVTDEELNGYVVSTRDITDRVRAQADHRETRERLEELTRATADVLWLFDRDWSEVLFVNPAYESLYGRPVAELETDPGAFLDAIHPDDVPAVKRAMEQLAAGTAVDMEYRVNPEGGYRKWAWVQGVPIVEDGEVVRIAGFSKDITERSRRERQLYVMENLLRHNLRNDMNIIIGSAETLEADIPESADRTAVIRRTGEAILASAEKGRGIIRVLTGSECPERLDLDEVVSAAVETVERRFPAARIDYTVEEHCSACVLRAFRYAVIELLENAILHNEHQEPSVQVTLDRVDDRVGLTIEDDALAIPDIEARVLGGDHEMTAVYHSTGLGLWLVYWIVELSDGWIDVQSHPEAGNRIRITLPLTET